MTKLPCIYCDATFGHHAGTPQVCGDCWDDLTPQEKAARWDAAKTIGLLGEIRTQFQHHDDHGTVIAGLQLSIERLTVLLKPVVDEVDDLAGAAFKMIRAFDQVARQELDGDDWKNST